MDDSLSISWERPAQPNDYTLNYTVSVMNISAGTELNRTVLNEIQLELIVTLSDTPCMDTCKKYIYIYCDLILSMYMYIPLQ